MGTLLLYLLITIFTTLQQGCADGAASPQVQNDSFPSYTDESHRGQQENRLRDHTLSDYPKEIAIIETNSNGYRLGSSRPQRLLPTPPARFKPSQGRSTVNLHHIQKIQKHFYGGKYVAFTAPFQASVSCDYYVIALRHIIR